ncbi:hypothetical protein ADZ37_10500 [Pannonibacter phragmitetus]|nr:hypothetical protein ADZ37_10500 [Pannonibacter phragmitetus]
MKSAATPPRDVSSPLQGATPAASARAGGQVRAVSRQPLRQGGQGRWLPAGRAREAQGPARKAARPCAGWPCGLL